MQSTNHLSPELSQFKNTHDSVLGLIGHTPLVRLNKVAAGVASEIYAKVEFTNPGGSVKDRIGLAMIEDAEKRGVLKPGGTIVECTSGNTGMGLAIAAAIKGYRCVFVLPDKMSTEKIRNLRAFGARVVVTPTNVEPDDPRSYYSVARQIAKETPNAVHLNQYDNLSNREAHFATTGPELFEQTNGGQFDAFVAGMGTGGTISGIAQFLKKKKSSIQIVGVDPIGSILFDHFKTGSKAVAAPYKIEGIGEDFIPKNYDFSVIDDMVQVNDKESFVMTRRLLHEEGLFVGVSCGAAVCGAIKYAQTLKTPKRIIVLLPDSGNRYLSKVFDDDWMRENGFLDSGWGTVADLLLGVKSHSGPIIYTKPDSSIEEVINLMKDKGFSQIPVIENNQVVGLVNETHLLSALFSGRLKSNDRVIAVAESNFAVLSPSDPVERVSQAITAGQTPIVQNQHNGLTIITKIDLITYLGNRTKH